MEQYGIPQEVKDRLRHRRLLPALWYAGPLELQQPEPQPTEPPAEAQPQQTEQ